MMQDTGSHASTDVHEIPFAMQAFVFLVLSQALKYWALMAPGPVEGMSARNLILIAILFLPFIVARVPVMLSITPQLFRRKEARVDIHQGGLVYTFDGVKRPLFVEWPDLERLERTRFGLVLKVRNTANVTEAMPSFQAQFWKKKIRRPIRLRYITGFEPEAALWSCLAAARQAGVTVTGFYTGHSHQRSMAAMSSSDQPK